MRTKSGWRVAATVGIVVCCGFGLVADTGTETAMQASPDAMLLEGYTPSEVQTATFALGCFWGPDARFGIVPGVIRTRVGYAGGTTPNPTYHDLNGHAEAVQIDFDPAIVTYDQLLTIFWDAHDPRTAPHSGQYRSMIFAHTPEQRTAAEASKAAWEADHGPALTRIVAYEGFTRAEGYHQKYRLQRSPLWNEILARFERLEDLVDSTVAARLNGYIARWGTSGQLQADLPALTLSDDAVAYLRSLYR
jgi:methionine-S-sulfoxide reductase